MLYRAKGAAVRYFERKGYDILARDFETPAGTIHFVLKDVEENVLVLCQVSVAQGGFSDESVSRGEFEAMCICYLVEHGESPDMRVRYDTVDLAVIGGARALLRHHINVLRKESE